MKINTLFILVISTLSLGFSEFALAQFANRPITVNDTLKSVRINQDNSVTFSIYAPNAKEVTLSGDYSADYKTPLRLTKKESGVWVGTTKPITPNVHSYSFSVDGVTTFDPLNKANKESNKGLSNLFEIPGKESEFLAMKNVPHGVVEIVNYWSSSLGVMRRMHIYLPPGYEKMKDKLPVLYLLHGGGDCDATWTQIGRANTILDNLYADGKVKPMVVVMPDGNTPGKTNYNSFTPGGDNYTRDFLNDVKPYVEGNYNVSKKPADRAIGGLSMGGMQTLNLALFYPELFDYVLALSTGYFPNMLNELEEKYSDVLKNPAIKKWKLFWIAQGGKQDIAYENCVANMKLFDKHGIKYEYTETPGAHSFISWKQDLYLFAPLLFKK